MFKCDKFIQQKKVKLTTPNDFFLIFVFGKFNLRLFLFGKSWESFTIYLVLWIFSLWGKFHFGKFSLRNFHFGNFHLGNFRSAER